MSARDRPIVLATGGTGGHMFPAEAVARELAARDRRLVLVTDRRGSVFGGGLSGIETYRILAEGVSGRRAPDRARALVKLGIGLLQARRVLRRVRPGALLGFGGYAAFPTVLAAIRARIPTALHEQNAVLGRANRMLAPRVDLVATSFPETSGLEEVDPTRVTCTGNPVRPAIATIAGAPYPPLTADGPVELLVIGGSQGAAVFSRIVPEAVSLLPEALRRRIRLSQQCRPEDIERVRAAYAGAGIEAFLAPFLDDMEARLQAAHLVVSRAGASTVAEITTVGRPAILVPFPHAIDDHQAANAGAVDEVGGGWLMPEANLTPGGLADRLQSLLALPDTLPKAAVSTRAAGRPDAAMRLADAIEGLVPSNGAAKAAAGIGGVNRQRMREAAA